MKGIIGRFFFQFGLTVAFAVLVSLFVSFTLDPMLSSRWHDPDIERRRQAQLVAPAARPLQRLVRADGRRLQARDRLGARPPQDRSSALAVAAFVGGLGVFGTLQTEFMTPMDQGEFVVKFKSAPGVVDRRDARAARGGAGGARRSAGGQLHLRHHRRRRRRHRARRDGVREARAEGRARDRAAGVRARRCALRLEKVPGIIAVGRRKTRTRCRSRCRSPSGARTSPR